MRPTDLGAFINEVAQNPGRELTHTLQHFLRALDLSLPGQFLDVSL